MLFVPGGWGVLLTATQCAHLSICCHVNARGDQLSWLGRRRGGWRGWPHFFGGGGYLRGEELATRHVPHSNAGSRFWAWTWPQECGSWERGRRAAASIDGAQVGVSSDYHKTARGCGSDPSFTAGTGGVSRAPHSLPGVGLSLSATHARCKVLHVLGRRKIKVYSIFSERCFSALLCCQYAGMQNWVKTENLWRWNTPENFPKMLLFLLLFILIIGCNFRSCVVMFFFLVCLCCRGCEPAHSVRACVCKVLVPVLKCWSDGGTKAACYFVYFFF